MAKFVELRDASWLLLGTSVGLFGTLNIDSNNTVWDRVSETEIGSNVVTAIDYRVEDGYLGVATHGGGVFSSYVTQFDNVIASAVELQTQKLIVFPNPARSIIALKADVIDEIHMQDIQVYNSLGNTVNVEWHLENNKCSGNIEHLPVGTYIIKCPIDAKPYISRFVKI